MSAWAIGIDLGGTAVKAAVASLGTGIVAERSAPTRTDGGPGEVVRQLSSLAAELYRASAPDLGAETFMGVGLGAPGAVSRELGTLSYPPNLPGWTVFPLQGALQACLQAEHGLELPVLLENDANLAALGEAFYGAGTCFDDFLMVTLGTGVGGGIILNRKLYRGGHGTAGEIGFMIIDFQGPSLHAGIRGTIEGLIGKERIVEAARSMMDAIPPGALLSELCGGDWERLSPRHLEAAALAGDRLSLAVWELVGAVLGTGLANVAALMDIRKFVIGGGIAAAGELIIRPALEQLRRSTLPSMHEGLQLVPAELGNRAGVHGAAALCLSET